MIKSSYLVSESKTESVVYTTSVERSTAMLFSGHSLGALVVIIRSLVK